MQIGEIALEICSVGPPRQIVDAGSRIALERQKCFPEQFDAEVGEE
jgi:hypothetical protein